jgi:hypothetical protein
VEGGASKTKQGPSFFQACFRLVLTRLPHGHRGQGRTGSASTSKAINRWSEIRESDMTLVEPLGCKWLHEAE